MLLYSLVSCLFLELEVAVESYSADCAQYSEQLVGCHRVMEQVEPSQKSDTELAMSSHIITVVIFLIFEYDCEWWKDKRE